MSLKINPKYGVYDLSFKSAVKSLIKDGFISQELIDGLYTKYLGNRSEDNDMTLEEAKADLHTRFSLWVWLCRTGTVECVKLNSYGPEADGSTLYSYGGHTRTCHSAPVDWSWGCYTLNEIRDFVQAENPDKTFVTVCRRTSAGVLEPVGYVI